MLRLRHPADAANGLYLKSLTHVVPELYQDMSTGAVPASGNCLLDDNSNLGCVILLDILQILVFLGQPDRQLPILVGDAFGLKPPLDLILHDLILVWNLNDNQRINLCSLLEKCAVQFPLLVQRLLQ